MKYQLETIPVWDAFKSECECPICALHDKAEQTYLKYYLGNSVMNPETRVEVNKVGFCPEHFQKLLQKRSPHYLGLMTHTHMIEYRNELSKKLKNLEKAANTATTKLKTPLKDKKLIEASNDMKDLIDKKNKQCMICNKIASTMKRYAFTTVYMWKKEEEFREYFNNSKGFCLPHFTLLNTLAAESLTGVEMGQFVNDLIKIQDKSLQRLEDELLYFTQKFSQENDDKPWNGTKDAHYRLIQKLTGKTTEH